MSALGQFKRWAVRLGAVALAASAAMPASARVSTGVHPYIEVQQVLNADLDSGETLTYTAVAAGVDAGVSTRRVRAQISYRYEKRFGWGDDLVDGDSHTGIAQLSADLIPNMLRASAGALATRARSDGVGPIFGFTNVDDPAISEVYSFYAGPELSTRIGALNVTGSYRFGLVEVDNKALRGLPLAPGAILLDRFDSSTNHSLSASVGMDVGELPFGWTVGGGYFLEEADRLDQEFEARFIRGDVVVPVGSTLALTAGVGYEKIESSQQDILRDAAGRPVVTPGGRLIGDPTKPRLLAYETDGIIWDAGVIYRPSRRTELQARVGQRYGGTTVTASLSHKINERYGLSASIYDGVETFGRLLIADLAAVPVEFDIRRNPLNNNVGGIGGCVFGTDPGTGACFDDAFQSIAGSSFRNRGANILFSGGRGPWGFGIGANYSSRRYYQPIVEQGFALDRRTDESFGLYAGATRDLSRTSTVSLDAYANWFDSGLTGAESAFSTGITGGYYQSFLFDRLQAHAALGLFTTDNGEFDSTVASALVGLRYGF
ncbi:MAG TPA: hypothetical protein VF631_06165 [Allosphingosinicella sp.]|jgi:hypothetical protein|uniref:hypothetical protein n=1 Tax=Allosphingosinicella sp. TaxID=2823234 RepID=UPI002F28B670